MSFPLLFPVLEMYVHNSATTYDDKRQTCIRCGKCIPCDEYVCGMRCAPIVLYFVNEMNMKTNEQYILMITTIANYN